MAAIVEWKDVTLMMKLVNGDDAISECDRLANLRKVSICSFDNMFDGDPNVANDTAQRLKDSARSE
jgi:hypothetical protein